MATQDLAARVRELEAQLHELRSGGAAPGEGPMLKALLDDIARRRHVEGQLNQAYEWLHLAQEAGKVAAYTVDLVAGSVEWSPSTAALYGFAADVEATIERWLSVIHPADREQVNAVVAAALEQGVDVDQRFRIVRPDGRTLWIQDRGRIILCPEGRPTRLVGINVDVSELVELEQRTLVSEERLRLAMKAEQIACWDWDPVSGSVFWDDNLKRQRGFAPDFAGSFEAFWELIHDADKPLVRQVLDDALAGVRDYELEFRMRRADGSLRWCHTRAVVVRNALGEPIRVVGVDADITERKAREAALRENDRFLQSVLDASTDCIKVIELDGTLSYMNRNGQCIMEVSDVSRLLGQPWANLWPAEGAARVREAKDKAAAGEASRFEAFCPTAKGTPKWWDVSVSPIRDEAGEPCRIVSISRDITDQRIAAEQLELFNAELHHRIKNTLATVQAMARASLRSAPDFTAFEREFSQRLTALAATYGLLSTSSAAASLHQLIRNELVPYDTDVQQVRVEGPELVLPAAQAVAMGMMLHELTTNACKYGCLCAPGGELDVRWRVEQAAGTPLLLLDWTERHERPFTVPEHSGFGSKLIDRLMRQHGGSADRDWSSGGLRLRLALPLARP